MQSVKKKTDAPVRMHPLFTIKSLMIYCRGGISRRDESLDSAFRVKHTPDLELRKRKEMKAKKQPTDFSNDESAVGELRLIRLVMLFVGVVLRPLATLRRGSFYQSVAECDGRYYQGPRKAPLLCGRSDRSESLLPTCTSSHQTEQYPSQSRQEPHHTEGNNTKGCLCLHYNCSPNATLGHQKNLSYMPQMMAGQGNDESKPQSTK